MMIRDSFDAIGIIMKSTRILPNLLEVILKIFLPTVPIFIFIFAGSYIIESEKLNIGKEFYAFIPLIILLFTVLFLFNYKFWIGFFEQHLQYQRQKRNFKMIKKIEYLKDRLDYEEQMLEIEERELKLERKKKQLYDNH